MLVFQFQDETVDVSRATRQSAVWNASMLSQCITFRSKTSKSGKITPLKPVHRTEKQVVKLEEIVETVQFVPLELVKNHMT